MDNVRPTTFHFHFTCIESNITFLNCCNHESHPSEPFLPYTNSIFSRTCSKLSKPGFNELEFSIRMKLAQAVEEVSAKLPSCPPFPHNASSRAGITCREAEISNCITALSTAFGDETILYPVKPNLAAASRDQIFRSILHDTKRRPFYQTNTGHAPTRKKCISKPSLPRNRRF